MYKYMAPALYQSQMHANQSEEPEQKAEQDDNDNETESQKTPWINERDVLNTAALTGVSVGTAAAIEKGPSALYKAYKNRKDRKRQAQEDAELDTERAALPEESLRKRKSRERMAEREGEMTNQRRRKSKYGKIGEPGSRNAVPEEVTPEIPPKSSMSSRIKSGNLRRLEANRMAKKTPIKRVRFAKGSTLEETKAKLARAKDVLRERQRKMAFATNRLKAMQSGERTPLMSDMESSETTPTDYLSPTSTRFSSARSTPRTGYHTPIPGTRSEGNTPTNSSPIIRPRPRSKTPRPTAPVGTFAPIAPPPANKHTPAWYLKQEREARDLEKRLARYEQQEKEEAGETPTPPPRSRPPSSRAPSAPPRSNTPSSRAATPQGKIDELLGGEPKRFKNVHSDARVAKARKAKAEINQAQNDLGLVSQQQAKEMRNKRRGNPFKKAFYPKTPKSERTPLPEGPPAYNKIPTPKGPPAYMPNASLPSYDEAMSSRTNARPPSRIRNFINNLSTSSEEKRMRMLARSPSGSSALAERNVRNQPGSKSLKNFARNLFRLPFNKKRNVGMPKLV